MGICLGLNTKNNIYLMEQDEIAYFRNEVDWKFFNALRDRILKYEDVGTLDCDISVEFKLDKGYYRIFRYKSDVLTFRHLNDTINHFVNNGSQLFYCIFLNDSDCLTELINSFSVYAQKYGYYAWRNGAYDVKYKKGNW